MKSFKIGREYTIFRENRRNVKYLESAMPWTAAILTVLSLTKRGYEVLKDPIKSSILTLNTYQYSYLSYHFPRNNNNTLSNQRESTSGKRLQVHCLTVRQCTCKRLPEVDPRYHFPSPGIIKKYVNIQGGGKFMYDN